MIVDIFPTPIYQADLNFNIPELVDKINEQGLRYRRSEYNMVSENTNLLDLDAFKELKEEILKHLDSFLTEIGYVHDSVYLTTSWLNINPPGGRHHLHTHPNSLISGIYYVDVPENSGNMVFVKTPSQIIDPADVNNLTKYSSDTVVMPSCTNRLFLFPSQLYHYVETNTSKYERLGISFNSFITGSIGHFTNRITL